MGASYRPPTLEELERKHGGATTAPRPRTLEELEAAHGIQAAPAAPPSRPGSLANAGSQLAGFGRGLIEHPGETLASFVTAPLASARDAVLAESEGEESEASVGYAGNRGGPMDPGLAALTGARRVGDRKTDASITPTRQREASVQTLVNLAIPKGAQLAARGALAAGAAPLLARLASLAGAGAAGGAAYSPDDPLAGALSGAVLAPVVHGAVKAGARVGGATGNALLRPAETKTLTVRGREVASIEGKVPRKARAEIAERRAQDLVVGAKPNVPAHSSLPAFPLDEHGPAVLGYAEAIANRPGAGGVHLRSALEGRQEQMRPAITGELERGTGVRAAEGLAPLEKRIATLKAEGDKAFDAAREATAGRAVQSPSLDAVRRTPVGSAALEWAEGRKAELGGSPLPKGADGATLPDPEVIHLAKRFLRQRANSTATDPKTTAEAQGALVQLEQVRAELPEEWRAADRIYAEHARLVEMANRGRNVLRTPANPPGEAKAALKKSLGRLESDAEKASKEGKAAVQQGAASALHAAWDAAGTEAAGVRSPGRVFARSGERVRQTRMGFPDDATAADFQQAVASWDAAQSQANRVLGGSQTARRGAEGSGAGAIRPESALEGPKPFARQLIRKVIGDRALRNQQRVEAEVAKLLTSRSLQWLPAETRAAAIAASIREMAAQGSGRLLAPPTARDDR